jgi:hypothetical protein
MPRWCVVSHARRAVRAVVAVFAVSGAAGAQTPPANDDCTTASPVVPGVNLSTIVGATSDGRTDQCAPTGADAWYRFTATVSGTHTIALCGSGFDTVLSLYTSCTTPIVACNDDACGPQSVVVAALSAGSTYSLRVAAKGAGAPGGPIRLTISEPTPVRPGNDSCGAAQVLTANTLVAGSTAGSGGSPSSTCGTGDTSDVWFVYSPTVSLPHRVQLLTSAFDGVLTVQNSCFGTAIGVCSTGAAIPGQIGQGNGDVWFTPTAGNMVIRVSGNRGSFGAFQLAVYAPRTNDLCAQAIDLVAGVPTTGFISPALGTEVSASCAVSGLDAWHAFTASESGAFAFDLCSSDFDTVLSVYEACDAPRSEIACADDVCGTRSRAIVNLQAGRRYIVRVAGKGSPPAFGTYSLVVNVQRPDNDLCANAATLSPSVPVAGSNAGATGTDISPCGTNDSADVWYAFTAPSAGLYEFNTCGSAIDTTLTAFTACAGAVLACSDNDASTCGAGSVSSRLTLSLAAGSRTLLRVAGVAGSVGGFTLAASSVPPGNDACASAATILVASPVSGTTTGASGSNLTACGRPDGPDAWYIFTAPFTRYYSFSACGSATDTVLTLYPTCPPASPIACNNDNPTSCGPGGASSLSVLVSAGSSVLVRVSAADPLRPGPHRLLVLPAGPPNDACASAARLEVNRPLLAGTIDAGASLTGQPPCGVAASLDTWFVFTPSAGGTYDFYVCPGAPGFTPAVALFASCSSGTLSCGTATGGCSGGLTGAGLRRTLQAGVSVHLRVAAVGDTPGIFTAWVTPARPANDLCSTAAAVGVGSVSFDTVGATTDAIALDGSCPLGFTFVQNDVWFRHVSLASGPGFFRTCGSEFDTVMVVYAGACPVGVGPAAGCNDDFDCGEVGDGRQSQVNLTFVAGRQYLVRVGAETPGAVGAGVFTVGMQQSCPCDANGDGFLTPADVFAFLNSYFQQGGVRPPPQTVFDFLACYFARPAGCL